MKTATMTLTVLAMISIASAVSLYSGDSYSFESPPFDYWSVVGNSSSMEGMTITYENGNTTISFDPLFISDSFTLLFWEGEEVVTEYIHTGGGGGHTVYRDRNNTVYLNNTVHEEGDTVTVTDDIRIKELEDELAAQKKYSKVMQIIAVVLGLVLLSLIVVWILKTTRDKVKNEQNHKRKRT